MSQEGHHGEECVEILSFIGWVASSAVFVSYFFWLLAPARLVNAIFPSLLQWRWVATALPGWLLWSTFCALIAYGASCLLIEVPLSSPLGFCDEFSRHEKWNGWAPVDMHLLEVNALQFGR